MEQRTGTPFNCQMASSQRGSLAAISPTKPRSGDGALFARAEEQAVAAGEADRRLAERAQSGDQALVHVAGKDHQRDVARLRVGDAQAVDELALLAQRLERAGQLHAAAMNHGHLVAVAHQLGDGARAAFEQRRSFQARSAQFDDVLHSRPSAANFMQDLPIRASPASRSDSARPGRQRLSAGYQGN